MLKRNSVVKKLAHRVIASLNRDQVDFLDKLGKDALFSRGTKLSRTQILSAMVNVVRHLNLSGDGIGSDRELERRILQLLKRANGGNAVHG